jgi:hypothetical protein
VLNALCDDLVVDGSSDMAGEPVGMKRFTEPSYKRQSIAIEFGQD